MKKQSWNILGLVFLTILLAGCSSDDEDIEYGNWISRSIFDGVPRSNAVAFTVGNFGYMGTGYDGDNYRKDFWEYNIEGDYWEQKADFPGVARSSANAFVADGYGYVGIGYNGVDELEDFWMFDHVNNTWEAKNDFLGGPRRAAISFGINENGYIGTGYDGENDKKDFYKYDASSDTWSILNGFGGEKRRDGTSFVINGQAYIGTGSSNGLYNSDFWVFDPASEVFTQLNDLDEDDDYYIERSNAVGFDLNNKGYIASGYVGGATGNTWEYDPTTDSWENISDLEGSIRQDAVSFSTGTRAYILLGRSGSLYLDDIYELRPEEEYDEED